MIDWCIAYDVCREKTTEPGAGESVWQWSCARPCCLTVWLIDGFSWFCREKTTETGAGEVSDGGAMPGPAVWRFDWLMDFHDFVEKRRLGLVLEKCLTVVLCQALLAMADSTSLPRWGAHAPPFQSLSSITAWNFKFCMYLNAFST